MKKLNVGYMRVSTEAQTEKYGLDVQEDKIKELAKKRFNIRDTASINQLVVLANMESYNSQLIKDGFTKDDRKRMLHKAAKEQLRVLNENNAENKFKKLEGNIPLMIE